jgi:hypothetical protein
MTPQRKDGSTTTPQLPPSLASRRWFRVAVVVVLGFSFVAAYALYRGVREAYRSSNFLDKMLGREGVLGVEESGFYAPEVTGSEPFRWTNGAAKLIVPTRHTSPKSLTVMLGIGVPKPIRLLIQVNGQNLFDQHVSPRENWIATFSLDNVPTAKATVIEILSDVFIPAQVNKKSQDTRALGVRVHGIVLQSGQQDCVDQPLGSRFVPGVEESGFYEPEQEGGQPFRWSNGAAKLVVPLGATKPKSLFVRLEIPKHAAKGLEIVVNGRNLLERKVQPQTNWKGTFPLDEQASMGETMTIEVRSATFVPAQIDARASDRRTLGVKVRSITLHRE